MAFLLLHNYTDFITITLLKNNFILTENQIKFLNINSVTTT